MRSELFYYGKPVLGLQRMLYLLSHADAAHPFVLPDGVYGTQTEAGVRAVQKHAGLPDTGVADGATWSAVESAYRQKLPLVEAAEPLVLLWDDPVYPGAENRHMPLVKAMLQTLAEAQGVSAPQTPGLLHDDASVAAVRQLQARGGLPQTGILDKPTWRLLARLYRTAVGSGA